MVFTSSTEDNKSLGSVFVIVIIKFSVGLAKLAVFSMNVAKNVPLDTVFTVKSIEVFEFEIPAPSISIFIGTLFHKLASTPSEEELNTPEIIIS